MAIVSDTISHTEAVTVRREDNVNRSDTTAITEAVSLNVPGYTLSVTVSDSATLSDAVNTIDRIQGAIGHNTNGSVNNIVTAAFGTPTAAGNTVLVGVV